METGLEAWSGQKPTLSDLYFAIMAFLIPLTLTAPSVTQCPVYEVCDSLDGWEEVLSDDECSNVPSDDKFAHLMQLLAQHDAKIAQKDAELAQKETEISFYDAELARKDNELDRKNADLDQKDTEIARLVQLLSQRDEELAQKNTELLQVLSQRDEESAQNTIVLNDVKQELLSAKQELAQRDAELAQERICIRDRTLPAPIDIQVKLGEMFKSWSGLTSHDTYLHPEIRASTEQIKEPIIGLFHVTYTDVTWGWDRTQLYADVMLFTATDVYYLSNIVYPNEVYGRAKTIRGVFIQNRNNSTCNYIDPVWVKLGAISENANFKKIIQCINQYSGYTGKDYHSNPNGGNNIHVTSGSETAMLRRKMLESHYMD